MERVIGADIVISVGNAVVGQRGAKYSGGQPNMIDVSVSTDFPDPKFRKGWKSPEILELDMLLTSGTDGGFAFWKNLAASDTLVDVDVTLITNGDNGIGQAHVLAPEFDANQSDAGSMPIKLQIEGALVWTSGT